MLRPDQQQRYARHLSLPGFGLEAQERLLASSVLLVGAGGLGSPAALYLAAAGVGRLVVVDDDAVDLSNLQRQVLHSTDRAGMPKVESAKRTINGINPDVAVVTINERFTDRNARELVGQCDLVLDGADNFPTRYLVNDAAYFEGKPVVHGSIHLFEGQCTVFARGRGPCYRCLFPVPPAPGTVPSCAEAGVLGVLPGIIGTAQATEAIKLLTGIGEPLIGRLLRYDALAMQFQTLSIRRNDGCPLCGGDPTIHTVREIEYTCVTPAQRALEIDIAEFEQLRNAGTRCCLLDVREPHEVAGGTVPGSLHIPLGQLQARIGELQEWRREEVVCICHVGIRSIRAAELLQQGGFERVASLRGGFAAWMKSGSVGGEA
ncbi:MAG: molybdopterin-synthase adenylyltransferase MoeB [Kiritimatiellae bacterium]|nr:molybdopterin-synthase adenylyltransferase MoeB [Kiritimatiellia bacterium]